MQQNSKCKICRRFGNKFFLKGEKCFSPKCVMIKKPYSPGQKGEKKTSKVLSEYGKELREKQKLKNLYGLNERQFKKYIKEVLAKRGKEDAVLSLIKKLESRLDNVIFRLGFAFSRSQARELTSHGHFLVNNKKVNFPSFELKKNDLISIRPQSLKNAFFKNIIIRLKKYQPPSWLELDYKKCEGKVINSPSLEEAAPLVEIPLIFEYYSR